MTVFLSPLFNDAQFDSVGDTLSGGQLYWYLSGTTTPATTYSDSLGAVPQANPIVLNIRGEPDNPIWLTSGNSYKAVLRDSLGTLIRTVDKISGVNDTSTPSISEWLLFSGAATYISATSFSVVGDQRDTFTYYRRIKAAVSGGVCYATIASSTYATGITTVTVTNDSTVLDAGLVSVYYGFLNPTYPSFNISPSIASGTIMPFYMATPPAGWTATTIQNDSMMRVVTSGATGGTSNGGGGHSPILNNVVASHTHSVTGTITDSGHSHSYANGTTDPLYKVDGNTGPAGYFGGSGTTASGNANISFSLATAVNTGATSWSPRYMDFCIGTKS